jgi:hypothetical protein
MKLLKPLFLIAVFILLSGCAVYTPDVAVVAPLGPIYVDPAPVVVYPYTYYRPFYHPYYAPRYYHRPGPMRGGPRR